MQKFGTDPEKYSLKEVSVYRKLVVFMLMVALQSNAPHFEILFKAITGCARAGFVAALLQNERCLVLVGKQARRKRRNQVMRNDV